MFGKRMYDKPTTTTSPLTDHLPTFGLCSFVHLFRKVRVEWMRLWVTDRVQRTTRESSDTRGISRDHDHKGLQNRNQGWSDSRNFRLRQRQNKDLKVYVLVVSYLKVTYLFTYLINSNPIFTRLQRENSLINTNSLSDRK